MKNVETLGVTNLETEGNVSESVNLSPIEKSLYSLDTITKKLGPLSVIILSGTFINLLCSIIVVFQVAYYSSAYSSGYYSSSDRSSYIEAGKINTFMTMFVFGCSFLFVVGALYFYELTRKRGDVLFEEISDELEWFVDGSKDKNASVRPEINARISLRSFTKTTNLPFVPGKFGPAFYLILNISLIIFSAFYVTRLF